MLSYYCISNLYDYSAKSCLGHLYYREGVTSCQLLPLILYDRSAEPRLGLPDLNRLKMYYKGMRLVVKFFLSRKL